MLTKQTPTTMKKLVLLFTTILFCTTTGIVMDDAIGDNSVNSTNNINSIVTSDLNTGINYLQSFSVQNINQSINNLNDLQSNVNTFIYTLNEGVSYQLTASANGIVNENVIINIYNQNGDLIGTNHNTELNKIYQEINFDCASAGNYYLNFEYIDSNLNTDLNNLNNNLNNLNNNVNDIINEAVVTLSFQS